MRTTFMGTPEFAIPCLNILKEQTELVGVVTQPDRPFGRKRLLRTPPVKEFAQSAGLPVYQPASIHGKEFIRLLEWLKTEIIVVVAFGEILPPEILRLPQHGCVNVHASLLPKYRGAAPVEWAIINGEKITGVTTIFMNETIDGGGIILQRQMEITPEDTSGTLKQKLAYLGAEVLEETIERIKRGGKISCVQNETEATLAPQLTRSDTMINWSCSAEVIRDLIRALDPRPGAFTYLPPIEAKKALKIWEVHAIPTSDPTYKKLSGKPGEIVDIISGEGPLVATGEGLLLLHTIQPAGRKKMKASDFLQGHALPIGSCFVSSGNRE